MFLIKHIWTLVFCLCWVKTNGRKGKLSTPTYIPQHCVAISPCVCKDEYGNFVDLRPLMSVNGTARFNDKQTPDKNLYSWNPCKPFTEESSTKSGNCSDVAICKTSADKKQFTNLGLQQTAFFSHFDNGNLSLNYYSIKNDTSSILSVVSLYCDEQQEAGFRIQGGSPTSFYWLQLWSKYACPRNYSTYQRNTDTHILSQKKKADPPKEDTKVGASKFYIPSRCTLISPCLCQDERNNFVDLRPLAFRNGSSRFTDTPTPGNDDGLYSWNPCFPFTEGSENNPTNCTNVAVCKASRDKKSFTNLGIQETASFDHFDNGNLSLTFFSIKNQTGSIQTVISLYCDPNVEAGFRCPGDMGGNFYWLQLRSKYACPRKNTALDFAIKHNLFQRERFFTDIKNTAGEEMHVEDGHIEKIRKHLHSFAPDGSTLKPPSEHSLSIFPDGTTKKPPRKFSASFIAEQTSGELISRISKSLIPEWTTLETPTEYSRPFVPDWTTEEPMSENSHSSVPDKSTPEPPNGYSRSNAPYLTKSKPSPEAPNRHSRPYVPELSTPEPPSEYSRSYAPYWPTPEHEHSGRFPDWTTPIPPHVVTVTSKPTPDHSLGVIAFTLICILVVTTLILGVLIGGATYVVSKRRTTGPPAYHKLEDVKSAII